MGNSISSGSHLYKHGCSGRNITWQYIHTNGSLPAEYATCPDAQSILKSHCCEKGKCTPSYLDKEFERYEMPGNWSWDGLGNPYGTDQKTSRTLWCWPLARHSEPMQPWTIEKREQQSINPVNESSPREEKDHQHFTFTYSYGDQLVPTPTLQRLISSATLSTAPTTFSTTFSIITGLPLQTDGAQQPISYPHDAEEQQQQPPRSNDSSSGTAPAVIASVSLVCILALILLAWYKRVCKKEYQWIGKQSWLSSQIERLDVRRGKTVQRSSMLWDQDAENVTLIDDSSVESD